MSQPAISKQQRSILLVAFGLQGGGAQEVCRNWAAGLGRLGVAVDVALLDPEPTSESPAVRELRAYPNVTILGYMDRGTGTAGRVKKLAAWMRAGKYSSVLSLETYPNLVAIIARLLIPFTSPTLILSEHNVPSILLRQEGIPRRLQLLLSRLIYRLADHVIGVSHAVATDLRCNFGLTAGEVSVLPNAVGAVTAAAVTEKNASASNSLRIVVPARLVRQKRPDKCVEVAAAAAEQFDSVELLWIGDTRSNDPIALPRTAGRAKIVHVSWQDDWAHQLVGSPAIVLLASEYEGFGNVLVEAAKNGIPVVAPSIALGCGDAVVPGVTGELAESDAAESYVEAIRRCLHYAPGEVDSAARWLRRFDSDTVVAVLLRITDMASNTSIPKHSKASRA